MRELTLPDHGGDLLWAQRIFGGATADWLDLSTGISPWSWPVPPAPAQVWQRLPEVDDSPLRNAAAEYYGCASDLLLPVPGSQFAIDCLPRIVPQGSVAVPDPGFSGHRRAWSAAGHSLVAYRNLHELAELIGAGDVHYAVVINPNNPTCEWASTQQLLRWHERLAAKDGLLIVDEAFADCRPDLSLAQHAHLNNLVILRSLGKFFGLAGVRLGFVLATPAILAAFAQWNSVWQVNHPAQWIGVQALGDRDWQLMQRRRIAENSEHLNLLLKEYFPTAQINCAGLFLTLSDSTESLYQCFFQLAEARVLSRFGRSGAWEWLRFGLPGDDLGELQKRLKSIKK